MHNRVVGRVQKTHRENHDEEDLDGSLNPLEGSKSSLGGSVQ